MAVTWEGSKGSLKQGDDRGTEAERGQGQEIGRTQWLIAWPLGVLYKYLLISLRVMSLTSAQVQKHKLLALMQYSELPLDATKEMQVLEGKLM